MGKDTQAKTPIAGGSKQRCGFTLIELMVVLFIMSMLGRQLIPTMADAWDKLMLRRIAAQVLVIISVARQHAIADERATLVHFNYKTWCVQYQDEEEYSCSLGRGVLPSHFYFNDRAGLQFKLFYSAGRGFSPLSAGAVRLFSQRSRTDVHFINSSIGRVRLCTYNSVPGIASC